MASFKIELELDDFVASTKKLLGNVWPKTVVSAFSKVANNAHSEVLKITKNKFKLKTNYILKGIKYYPSTQLHKNISENGLKKYGDMEAAVFVRGSGSPKYSLEFMAHHEYGKERKPRDKFIAMPTKTLKKYSYKNPSGSVKTRWKPATLLKTFKESGSYFNGSTTLTKNKKPRKSKRLPGKGFLIGGKSGNIFLARRIKRGEKGLEFLYVFKNKATIDKHWNFEETVWDSVKNACFKIFNNQVKMMKIE